MKKMSDRRLLLTIVLLILVGFLFTSISDPDLTGRTLFINTYDGGYDSLNKQPESDDVVISSLLACAKKVLVNGPHSSTVTKSGSTAAFAELYACSEAKRNLISTYSRCGVGYESSFSYGCEFEYFATDPVVVLGVGYEVTCTAILPAGEQCTVCCLEI